MKTLKISKTQARQILLKAAGLSQPHPVKNISKDLLQIIHQIGYLQIDTISVIERAHHHILWSRWPGYQLKHLHQLQAEDKSIFEYWTHALAYVPTKDYKYFVPQMKNFSKSPGPWMNKVTPESRKELLKRIQKQGPLSISDVKDDVLVEKDHDWASKKPSKRVMQYLFHSGELTISRREGMRKYYELTQRHFQWKEPPKACTSEQQLEYWIERSLRSQGLISVDSVGYLKSMPVKKEIFNEIHSFAKKDLLIPVEVEGLKANSLWIKNDSFLESKKNDVGDLIHILSPFDPLVIQRKRLHYFFDYQHLFEAYIPIPKRKYGYFGLPVFSGDQVVSVIDFKTDRVNKKLLVQKWTWLGKYKSKSLKVKIEEKIDQFEDFQLSR